MQTGIFTIKGFGKPTNEICEDGKKVQMIL